MKTVRHIQIAHESAGDHQHPKRKSRISFDTARGVKYITWNRRGGAKK